MLTLDAAKPHTSISELKCFIGCPRKHTKVHLERAVPAFRPLASLPHAPNTAINRACSAWMTSSARSKPIVAAPARRRSSIRAAPLAGDRSAVGTAVGFGATGGFATTTGFTTAGMIAGFDAIFLAALFFALAFLS